MIKPFGYWDMVTQDNYSYFLYCRNELVPEVREGFRILWSVSRALDTDGVYRGASVLRGYYVKHPKPATGVRPDAR